MNARATKLQAAETDLKQLMADVARAVEKAQEAVARITSKVAAAPLRPPDRLSPERSPHSRNASSRCKRSLAKLEATAARHRADYERERDRADRLVSELLKVTANTTNEMAAKLEGEIAALRLAAEGGADIMGARAALEARGR